MFRFENILEPSTLLRVCLQNICDIWNIRKCFWAINPTFVCKIFEIFANKNQPRSACVCKTLTVSPPSPAGTCCLNKRRETDHVSWRDRFQNIWRIWKHLQIFGIFEWTAGSYFSWRDLPNQEKCLLESNWTGPPALPGYNFTHKLQASTSQGD